MLTGGHFRMGASVAAGAVEGEEGPARAPPGRAGGASRPIVAGFEVRDAAPLQARSPWGILPQPGGGWAPVGSPVFKTGGGSFGGPRGVRLPSPPPLRFLWAG